jgi:hypothetical protein
MVKKKKRHLTPQEIMAQCNAIAREKRMADRSPWSAMGVMCSYVLLKQEGFKGQRILRITTRINKMEERWSSGELKLADVKQRLWYKAEWTIEYKAYTDADITEKQGTYQYWLDKKQQDAQNIINEQATRYMLFFFAALMDEYGYGKERLTRVQKYMNGLLDRYQKDMTSVREWQKALLDEAGIVIEMPVDPLTQTSGCIVAGY